MSFTGKFIVVEGIDGSGKTTLANAISTYLQDAGIKVMQAREPGGTPHGEKIRELFKDRELFNQLNPTDKALLMNLSRSFLLKEIVEFRFKNPEGWVVLDRHHWTTFAYQGAEGAGISWLHEIDMQVRSAAADASSAALNTGYDRFEWFLAAFPDYYFYLDIPIEIAKQRIQSTRNGNISDQYDEQGIDFFKKVQEIFLNQVRVHRDKSLILDATKPLEINLDEVLLYLKNKLYSNQETKHVYDKLRQDP